MAHPSIPRPSTSQLRSSTSDYRRLLAARTESGGPPKERANLVELDDELWASGESSITGRLREKEAELSQEELKKCMTWKLARGKFRPTLLPLISSNSSEQVKVITRQAFSQYAHTPSGALASLKTLCTLRGVGPATASLLLSLYRPQDEAYMSDEALLCLGCPLGYTEKIWKDFRGKVGEEVRKGTWDSARELEKGCWAWAMRMKEEEEMGDTVQEAANKVKGTTPTPDRDTSSHKVDEDEKSAKARAKRALPVDEAEATKKKKTGKDVKRVSEGRRRTKT